jgi:phosphatidylserine/phosphatidylglycerophosphate/cardiolipin synthase-like enzyme
MPAFCERLIGRDQVAHGSASGWATRRCWRALLALGLLLAAVGTAHADGEIAPLAPAAGLHSTGAQTSVGFSPDGSAERLVLGAIAGARHSIQLAAYGFTASAVAKALIAAHKRGVKVRVLLDWKANFEDDRRYARHAIGALLTAGVEVRSIDAYPIFHDKFMVIDGRSVQTGSYNYSVSAARYNAENVLVVWNDPALAAAYARNWEANWALGRAVEPRF